MAVVIEEMTAEVLPVERPAPERGEARGSGRADAKLADRVRDALARERRRTERLSDR